MLSWALRNNTLHPDPLNLVRRTPTSSASSRRGTKQKPRYEPHRIMPSLPKIRINDFQWAQLGSNNAPPKNTNVHENVSTTTWQLNPPNLLPQWRNPHFHPIFSSRPGTFPRMIIAHPRITYAVSLKNQNEGFLMPSWRAIMGQR